MEEQEYGQKTVRAIRRLNEGITLETLIPDFKGEDESLQKIIDVKPEIVSHNMETVERLSRKIRVQAKYDRSLDVLEKLRKSGMKTKSGIMLGLGETYEEIIVTLKDLKRVDCQIITIGQYLQPTPKHAEVKEFVSPETFKKLKILGEEMGFSHVESGPLVRSSYHAEEQV